MNGDDHSKQDESGVQNDLFPGKDEDNGVCLSTNKCPEPPLAWKEDDLSYYENREASSTLNVSSEDSQEDRQPDDFGAQTGMRGNEDELNRARKFVIGSQAVAIVSLFIGGVVLSAVAVGLAVYGYKQTCIAADSNVKDENLRAALKRSGGVAIAMTSVALAVNIAMLVLYFPTYVEMLQQYGLYGTAETGATQIAPAPSKPGTTLFG